MGGSDFGLALILSYRIINLEDYPANPLLRDDACLLTERQQHVETGTRKRARALVDLFVYEGPRKFSSDSPSLGYPLPDEVVMIRGTILRH